MTLVTATLLGFVGLTTAIHLVTIGIVAVRLRCSRDPVSTGCEGITLVEEIAVHPDYHGMGVGSFVLEQMRRDKG